MKKKKRKRVLPSRKILIDAPRDMRVLGPSIKDVLVFFRELRTEKNWSQTKRGKQKIEASLKDVEEIDYAAISILTAIAENLKKENKLFSFTPPVSRNVRKQLFFSGMLKHFYDEYGKKGRDFSGGKLINLKDGFGRLKAKEMEAVMLSLDNMLGLINYPLDEKMQLLKSLRSVILEICGNAIEWGYGKTEKKWILGLRRESETEITITFTDIGNGILKTLKRKPQDVVWDVVAQRNNSVDILRRVFEKKYGSSTNEPNRNRGLPMIKKKLGDIKNSNLKVLTNDALLAFDNPSESKNLKDIQAHFHGTFYQWSIKNGANQNL